MKRIITILALLIIGCNAATAEEPQLSWIFNGGDDVSALSVGQGNVLQETKLTRFVPIGTDCTITLPVSSKNAFDAQAFPFFAFRYKYKSAHRQAGLFFTTDTLTSLSDKSYSPIAVEPDNTWRNCVVDMRTYSHKQWTGKITGARFDPTNPSTPGDVLQLSRMGFFPTKEAAEAFLSAAVDAPDYSEDSVFRAPLQKVFVPGGCLSDGYNKAEYMLPDAGTYTIPETKYPEELVVVFTPKDGGKPEVVPVCQTNSRGFTGFVARKPGKYTIERRECKFTDVVDDDPFDWGVDIFKCVRFVLARGLMTPPNPDKPTEFDPDGKVSKEQWSQICNTLKEHGIELNSSNVPDSRLVAAERITLTIERFFGSRFITSFTNEYITSDRIKIGAWVNLTDAVFDKDFVKTYSEGGFDWMIAHSVGGSDEKTRRLLDDCDRYGVELILGDGAYTNPAWQTAEYFDRPCFAGTYVTDEPGTDDYDHLAAICNKYVEQTGKVPYINLLPMYANAAQLKYGAGAAAIEYYDSDPDLFKKYCDSFCEKFNVNYICTDIYPLNWRDGKRVTYSEYIESINIIARSAREHNKEFWCCLQTFAWTPSKRTPTEAEFRWQAYSLLSFGCKGLLCWTYVGYKPEFPSLLTIDGKRTNAWYDAATVFKEIKLISDAYVQYKNLGAFTVDATDYAPYLKMSNPVTDFKGLEDIYSFNSPLLVGCFEKKDGYAFTVVNMSELEYVQRTEVEFKLPDGYRAVSWQRGVRTELTPDKNGVYHLILASGEGVFVEVVKDN
ncbi:MAG: hypothetical protein IJF84_04315 [Thermoguttaceae bacterium]|nr:hypothetical protein [Thermoguttaceae bacterium]